MTWGPCFMYYHCKKCGKKFKYSVDLIPVFNDEFGFCPDCKIMGEFEKDGARTTDDLDYEEVYPN